MSGRGSVTLVGTALAVLIACSAGAYVPTAVGAPSTAHPPAAAPDRPDSAAAPDDKAPITDYIIGRPANSPWRPVPDTRAAQPVQVERLHMPEPTPDVAPIAPPTGALRVGNEVRPAPAGMSQAQIDQLNGLAAGLEARISTVARSVGVPGPRADKMAAAAVGPAAAGAAGGCAVGAAAGAIIGIPLGGVLFSWITSPPLAAGGCALGGGLAGATGLLGGAAGEAH
ncbi:MAG: hypothetical protein HOQ24_18540 [Mycobacteriaceae bacterium]|nr:hypothetical protein [Mycobacteriaceae bacterium]